MGFALFQIRISSIRFSTAVLETPVTNLSVYLNEKRNPRYKPNAYLRPESTGDLYVSHQSRKKFISCGPFITRPRYPTVSSTAQ